MRKLTVAAALVAFVATVYAANYAVQHHDPIRVWPTHLLAPAGVVFVALAFLLRDTVQRLGSKRLALAGIAAGTILTFVFVSHALAFASACAFVGAECVGLVIFWALQRRLLVAVGVSQVIAAALDSFLFLSIAFGVSSLGTYFYGQFVAKVALAALALPVVLLARRFASPEPASAAA